MSTKTLPFAERLLNWWDMHGRKSLPWQQRGNAYAFWIAEVMLQQTQVATVIPYFERFMASFHDLPSLADADQDAVLAHWSGLGYYSRARNLHRAAQLCIKQHGGHLPDEPGELEALPGIGRSTANAIISQSTDRVLPILDGNVKRLLARHAGVRGWPGQSKIASALWELAEQRLPDRRGADYTQAAMDLGALLCTRSKPDCAACPVSADCYALRHDCISELPGKKPKTDKRSVTLHVQVRRDAAKKILLVRRPPAGIWGGLWCLPEGRPGSHEKARRQTVLKHELTHRSLSIIPWAANGADISEVSESDGRQWFTIEQALSLGLPQPIRKMIEELE